MSEDEDDPSEHCPICKDKECQLHLLARFDVQGDGEFGVGLAGGALCEASEIATVLERARLAWVQSMRATGKPEVPPWIMQERGLRDYFDALGGIDVEKYHGDEDAVHDLKAETEMEIWHAREDFLWEALHKCGWFGEKTEEQFDVPLLSTRCLSWWAFKPAEIVTKFRAKLRMILLEVNSTAARTNKREPTKSPAARRNKRGRPWRGFPNR
jgi:hypothetical protein